MVIRQSKTANRIEMLTRAIAFVRRKAVLMMGDVKTLHQSIPGCLSDDRSSRNRRNPRVTTDPWGFCLMDSESHPIDQNVVAFYPE